MGEGYERRTGSALKDSKEVVDDVVALMEHLTHQLQAAGSDCARVQAQLTRYQHAMARYHAEGVGLGNLLADDDMELVKEYAEAQVQSFAADLQASMSHAEAFCGLSEGAFLSPASYSTYEPDYGEGAPAGEARWGGEGQARRGPLEAPRTREATVRGVRVTSSAGRMVDVHAPPGQHVATVDGRGYLRIVPAGLQGEPQEDSREGRRPERYPALAQRRGEQRGEERERREGGGRRVRREGGERGERREGGEREERREGGARRGARQEQGRRGEGVAREVFGREGDRRE
ncbi:hypothetical protein T484DRAFT_1931451 [Baffinella frigidus]|nr:hypothetical protein T484DRAFT_1931451 [Cryptophyta sp. CCMP2293]